MGSKLAPHQGVIQISLYKYSKNKKQISSKNLKELELKYLA
jgi:hypothetical protein